MKRFLLLRQAMLTHDCQQKDAARIVGICDAAMSARMHGRAEFSAGEMVRLGKALDIAPADYYEVFLADTAAGLEGKRV
mgnify:CR=1 FL=1